MIALLDKRKHLTSRGGSSVIDGCEPTQSICWHWNDVAVVMADCDAAAPVQRLLHQNLRALTCTSWLVAHGCKLQLTTKILHAAYRMHLACGNGLLDLNSLRSETCEEEVSSLVFR